VATLKRGGNGRRKKEGRGYALFNAFVFKFLPIARKRKTKENELGNEQSLFWRPRFACFHPVNALRKRAGTGAREKYEYDRL
jgi:hypothetical protein